MSIGENIRKRRLALHLSQQELADALGYKTRSSIAKIEKNSSALTPEKLLTLAHVLHTSVSFLVNGENDNDEKLRGTVISSLQFEDNRKKINNKQKCVAVILAGGKNRVNKYNIPYQFVTVKDKPILFYTIEAFQHHPQVDEIHVVCLEGWEDLIPAYAEKLNITKMKEIIPAGKTGIESVKNAVEWLSPSHAAMDLFLICEATRPLVTPETITNAIRCCKQFGSAVTFERMDKMTPFLLNEDSHGLTHLPANRVINIQSPEVYTFGALRQAFYDATKIGHALEETICAVFLHNMGRELKFCEGSHSNRRIIYEEDLKLLEHMV